ncbi:uncharacterized protein LOC114301182 isoform X1 [Camellia sinensis]|uniref:uncharacterized protein LOC114301182 isoform X1 n=1 Tax=Camellia sinensis TaxID=4442 RepID=UPI001036B5A2|nr:uncharacterized protein LOC114301182 isoform X1 [Camellia sinensis]
MLSRLVICYLACGILISCGTSLGVFLQWVIQVIVLWRRDYSMIPLSWMSILKDKDVHVTGNLLRIAIFNISYIRGLFPEKYFHDKSVPALRDEDQEAYTNGCKVLQTN